MESFEFLGGRYNRPEQIMSGPMQAFRAQNAATDTAVFIHRVSTKEAPEEQAALLKLLTTALVKSADAKRLVLDFGEERGYWYVVTESDPQCALLREWLQMEIDAAAAGSRLSLPNTVAKTPNTAPPAPPQAPQPASDPGEFTRFLTRTPIHAAKQDSGAGEFTRAFQSKPENAPLNVSPQPAPQAPQRPLPPAASSPGEFTSFFKTGDAQAPPLPKQPDTKPAEQRPVAPPPPPLESKPAEPAGAGEFTRFFSTGLPASPPKPATFAPPPTLPQRPPNQPFVQRPNTPIPPPPPPTAKPKEEGEFTRIFSRPANAPPVMRPPGAAYQPPAPPTKNDPFNFSRDTAGQPSDQADDLFSQKIDIPKPIPPSRPPQGDFTRMFGSLGDAPPAMPPQAVVAQPHAASPLEDRAHLPPPPSQSGASEFTRIMQGPPKPAVPAPPSIPQVALPSVNIPKPALPTAPAGVAGTNKKLIIFFSILGILAIVLVLLMLFVFKK